MRIKTPKGCSVAECERRHHAHGKCHKHFKEDWRKANPEMAGKYQKKYDPQGSKGLERRKMRRHGISDALAGSMRDLQNGRCAICPRELHPHGSFLGSENRDHCHATKAPRGLLCKACNHVLGWYEKHQRPFGLRIQQYEEYLETPTYSKLRNIVPSAGEPPCPFSS